jgi:hypothetical protein
VPGPAGRSQQAQPSEPTIHERAFLYQFFGKAEAPIRGRQTRPVLRLRRSCMPSPPKPKPCWGEARAPANPTTPLRNAHSYGMCTRPPQARPGPSACVPLPEPVALPETTPGAESEAA